MNCLMKMIIIYIMQHSTFSGKPEEYQAAKEQFFQPILNELGLKPNQLFIVPGNHDLDNEFILSRRANETTGLRKRCSKMVDG